MPGESVARWRRLDVPGTDECRLARDGGQWLLRGRAMFEEPRGAARLEYRVRCDARWQTIRGDVQGDVGGAPLQLTIARSDAGEWTVNGRPAPDLAGLVDLDLGFTPATNLFPMKRLALAVGESADAEAAWLDDVTWTLRRLPQRYTRRSATSYWYESPTAGYSGLLTVDPEGFVRDYPELWVSDEAAPP